MAIISYLGELAGSIFGASLFIIPIALICGYVLRKFTRLTAPESALIALLIGAIVTTFLIVQGGSAGDSGPHPSVTCLIAFSLLLGIYKLWTSLRSPKIQNDNIPL